MRVKNISMRLLMLQVLGFISTSCTLDHKVEKPVLPGDNTTVSFSLNVPGNSMPATRGLSGDDETNVETVDLLLFRKNGDSRLYWDKVTGISLDNAVGNVKTFKAVITVRDYTNYDITVVANGRDIISGAGLSQGDEKSVALGKLTKTMTVGEKWNSNKIPMWGEALNVEIGENTSLSGVNAVNMTRMIARIDVKLSKKAATGSNESSATGNANFELTSVRLYNYSTVGMLTPDLVNGWGGDPVRATAPNQPAQGYGKVLYNSGNEPLLYTATDQHSLTATLPDSLIRAIYTLEAPKGSGSTRETNTCLVIGGKYRGSTNETYYRIDFAKQNNLTHQNEYLDLLRNHHYIVNITKISGIGFETPDEAFYSHPVNIEVGILEWNDGEVGDIIFDGQYYLGVSPAEFVFYKEAGSGNRMTITTDVPSGWKIAGITDSNQPGAGSAIDWIYDPSGSFSMPGNKDPLTFSIKENETGGVRHAWIHIKAGRLNFAVKVTQYAESDPQNYRISVTDNQGNEIGELFFTGEATVSPDPQDFNVKWFPAGSLLKATIVSDYSSPLSGSYNPALIPNSTNMLTWESDGRKYTFSPDPIGESSEPFFEKSSKVLFELQTPTGPISKTLTLRQTNFNLIPQIETMLMNGKPQSFGVRANFTWKAEFAGASSEDAPSFVDYDIVKKFNIQYGGNNTTQPGDMVTFTCKDFISSFSSANPKEAEVKVKFSRLDKNQWVEFGTYVVPCYSALAVGESNSYMIDNAQPIPILIPVSQVGYAMKASESGFLGDSWITDYGKLKVQTLWSDVNKFGTADAVVRSVSYNGAKNVNDGKILMIPGSGAGNSLIILYEDNNDNGIYEQSGDVIRWSWHIWNTAYHPYDASGNPKASGNAERWMDRNLGAMSNTPGDAKTFGFHYQWGRKDPFPSNNQWNAASFNDYLFYAAGSGVKFNESDKLATINLPNSVNNPLTRYFYGSSPSDWFTTSSSMQNGNLWGGGTKTDFLHASGKSVYDPCPEGYRIPKYGADGWGTMSGEASWNAFADFGRINTNYGGYYPAAGGRCHNREGLDGYSSKGGYYWQDKSTSLSGYYIEISNTKIDPNIAVNRAYGFSVRCVKE